MSDTGVLGFAAHVLATLLRPVVAVWECLSSPVFRLARLTRLRSRSAGHVPVTTQFDGPLCLPGRVELTLGEHCRLGRGVQLETCGGKIALGSHTRVNTGSVLVAYASIAIGDDCLIGEYVSIRDADHGSELGAPMRTQRHDSAPIVIGNDVWIARGAVILKGVKIGNGAIVAANSVVNRDVAENSIVGGVPARVLKSRAERPGSGP